MKNIRDKNKKNNFLILFFCSYFILIEKYMRNKKDENELIA